MSEQQPKKKEEEDTMDVDSKPPVPSAAEPPGGEDQKRKKNKKEEDLSEEDLQIKEEIALLVERVRDVDAGVAHLALVTLGEQIRTSTSSMTGVPKPLKFLRPFLDELTAHLAGIPVGAPNREDLAEILSVLAMTHTEEPEARLCLKYRLEGPADPERVCAWGHEYIRFLAGEVAAEYIAREVDGRAVEELDRLIETIVPFLMTHHSEPNACDLLTRVGKLHSVARHVEDHNAAQVCLYLSQCARYLDVEDGIDVLKVVLDIHRSRGEYSDAMVIALLLNDIGLMGSILNDCTDPLTKKQLGFLLARQHVNIQVDDPELSELVNGTHLSAHYLALAKDLDVLEPKAPADVYKSHVAGSAQRSSSSALSSTHVDSARANLAATFVNAFVNVGFGTDRLLSDEGSNWLYKNKDVAMTSAAASLGLVHLWDVDTGLSEIDKYLYVGKEEVKAGALLGVGILSCGCRNDFDPAKALLDEHLDSPSVVLRSGAVLGLGIAYAGTAREDILEGLQPTVLDTNLKIEYRAMGALSVGMVYVASNDSKALDLLVESMLKLKEADLKESWGRLWALGVALIVLGRQEMLDGLLGRLEKLPESVRGTLSLVCEVVAYACTGRVLTVQKLLGLLSAHDSDSDMQCIAGLGLALVARGEELGEEMVLRMFNRLNQYSEVNIRRSVPLALAFLCASNPKLSVVDTLSKLSHDADADVARSAVIALGIVGAGTNNSRVGGLLHSLADFYAKSPSHLFMVRLAQGLLHLGKGIVTLDPFHSRRTLYDPRAVGALIASLFLFLDAKTVATKYPHLFFEITPAISPRMLVTVNAELKPIPIQVRVGQAVDVVGQAGKPKMLTGFQTHKTPVLIGYGEGVELASDEFIPLSNILEGVVIVKPNPNATGEEP